MLVEASEQVNCDLLGGYPLAGIGRSLTRLPRAISCEAAEDIFDTDSKIFILTPQGAGCRQSVTGGSAGSFTVTPYIHALRLVGTMHILVVILMR